jgi:hypothetical protein
MQLRRLRIFAVLVGPSIFSHWMQYMFPRFFLSLHRTAKIYFKPNLRKPSIA